MNRWKNSIRFFCHSISVCYFLMVHCQKNYRYLHFPVGFCTRRSIRVSSSVSTWGSFYIPTCGEDVLMTNDDCLMYHDIIDNYLM
jgi:hypothetical protein